MPLTLPPPIRRDDDLRSTLVAATHRRRRALAIRGVSGVIVVAVIGLAALAVWDWLNPLPPLVRGLGLVALLAGMPLLFLRWVKRPMRGSSDPLQTALAIERAHPEFNDSLASAVQFLDADDDRYGEFHQAAVRRAGRKAERHDFPRILRVRWTRRSLVAAILFVAGAVVVVASRPAVASNALRRIALPFESRVAETKTRIVVRSPDRFPHRAARGEPLDLRIAITGVVPDRVSLSIQIEGSAPVEQSYPVAVGDDDGASDVTLRIEPNRIPRDFRFRVRGHDGDTGWLSVTVAPPPTLVAIDGRPSPRVTLRFPAYTDLPDQELPDGSGVIECVVGTRATLLAATDRPVSRAWIGYRPNQPLVPRLAGLSPLAAINGPSVAALHLLSNEIWQDVPVEISDDGQRLRVAFTPRMSGPHALRFEDETGLGGTRLFDVRVTPDLAPVVSMDRPSATRESLHVLPDAELTFSARVADPQFAVRRVWLSYRTNRGPQEQMIAWYDADIAGRTLKTMSSFMRIAPPPLPEPRLRLTQWSIEQRRSIAGFRHSDGSSLVAGDVVIVRVMADDFDDVSPFKATGQGHEIELIIVGKEDLEAAEQQAQGDIRAEILELHARQREARTRVQEAMRQVGRTGSLRPEEIENLHRVEQTQQQIRGRINDPATGLRATLEKLRQTAEDNKLPRSIAASRLDDALVELNRLAANEFEPLEADLVAARQPTSKPQVADSLGRAERRQKGVEETLLSLLERLEPWSGVGEIRGEARSLLQETKRQADAAASLGDKVPPEKSPDDLTPTQRAELDRATVGGERLSERGRQLMERIARLAIEKEAAVGERHARAAALDADAAKASPSEAADLRAEAKQARESAADLAREAEALRQAAMAGDAESIKERLRQAAESLRGNQPAKAADGQRAAAANLERMLAALEKQQTEDMDRLAKKLRDANRDVQDLADRQDKLLQKADAARDRGDSAALRDLAAEQAKLEEEARLMAQRLARENAGEPLRQAARDLRQAREQMERGEPGGDRMEEALERLDEAKAELRKQQEAGQEELEREQAAKSTENLQSLRDRQQRHIEEMNRIDGVVSVAKKWERPLRASLNDLRQLQQSLAKDVTALRDTQFAEVPVYNRMMRQSAEAMELAGKRMLLRLDAGELNPFDAELEAITHSGIASQQRLALKRMDQLLEALKPGKEEPPPAKSNVEPPPPKKGPAEESPSLPPLAQLMALRALQADIGERTAAFDKAHPDRTKLNDDEVEELQALERMQREVAELVKSLPEPDAKEQP